MIDYHNPVDISFYSKVIYDYRLPHISRNLSFLSGYDVVMKLRLFNDGIYSLDVYHEQDLSYGQSYYRYIDEYLFPTQDKLNIFLNDWIKKCKSYRQKHA